MATHRIQDRGTTSQQQQSKFLQKKISGEENADWFETFVKIDMNVSFRGNNEVAFVRLRFKLLVV